MISVAGAQSTNEDTSLVFNGANLISFTDADEALNPVTSQFRAILTVGNGTLSLSGTTGLSFITGDGTNDPTMTFTGSLGAVNAAIDGLTFTPSANVNGGAVLTVAIDDQGNFGAGGAMQDSETVNLTINALNDPPVLANIEVADVAYAENDPPTQITNAITVTDVDDTNIESATVQITANYQNGQDVLSASDLSGGITANFVAGSGTLTLSGSATLAN